MRHTTRLWLTLGAMLWTIPAAAQSAPDSSAADPRLDLLRGITLSPAQKARIDSLNAEVEAHAKAADAKSNSAGEVMVRLQSRLVARDSAVRTILTPEQMIIYRRNLDSLRAWAKRERH